MINTNLSSLVTMDLGIKAIKMSFTKKLAHCIENFYSSDADVFN